MDPIKQQADSPTPAPSDREFRRSRKWIQELVCNRADQFALYIREAAPKVRATAIDWRSPRANDFREYRDGKALDALGLGKLRDELARFWPARGPVWDALGVGKETAECFLLEAKAHIPEVVSSPSKAQGRSRTRIRGRLNDLKRSLGSTAPADWSGTFYQYANRLAYLHWLRSHHVPAFLVSVYFTNAPDVPNAVKSPAEWQGALTVIRTYLGLGRQHPLKPFVVDVFVDVEQLRRSREFSMP